MTKKPKPNRSSRWGAEDMEKRLHRCVTMLAVWGGMSGAESRKAHDRIKREAEKGRYTEAQE